MNCFLCHLITGQIPYIVTWCSFNDTQEPMSVTSELAFDPSNDFHSIEIEFFHRKEDIKVK